MIQIEAVLDSYGWDDIELKHNFYDLDYLPQNDRIRFTMQPDTSKAVLNRLLELNHQKYKEEIYADHHKKADLIKFYEQKGRQVPDTVLMMFEENRRKKPKPNKYKEFDEEGNVVKEPKIQYGLNL